MRPFLLCLVAISCAPPLPLEGAPCPCVTGWVCCPGIKLCAAGPDRCEAVLGPEVSPTSAEVGVGRSLQFRSSAQGVTWEMQEGLIAGSIDANGLYVAPPEAGVVHVVARSALGATRATVNVRELRLSVLAGRYGGPSGSPIDGVGPLARLTAPLDGVFVGGAYFFRDESSLVLRAERTLLRRYDPLTRRVDTLFEATFSPPVDGPPGVGRFSRIGTISQGSPDSLLVLDDSCVRELSATTMTLLTLFCVPPAPPYNTNFTSFVGDGEAVYATKTTNVVVRLERDGGAESVLSGVPGVSGAAGLPHVSGPADAGLFHRPGDLVLSGPLLYLIDQDHTAVRELNLVLGTLRTLKSDPDAYFTELTPTPGFPIGDGVAVLDVDGTLSGGFRTLGRARGLATQSPQSILFTEGSVIRSINPFNGVEQVVAGKTGAPPTQEDGRGEAAGFSFPWGPELSIDGNTLYVSEQRAGTIRAVTREGEVTTPFVGVNPTSIAVDATHVYAFIDQTLNRAPKQGGAWERMDFAFANDARLLGVMADGRIVIIEGSTLTISFVEPATFSPTAQRLERLGRIPNFDWPIVLDPSGGVFFGSKGVRRLDLANGQVSVVISPEADASRSLGFGFPFGFGFGFGLAAFGGKFYAWNADRAVNEQSGLIFVFDPAVGGWQQLVGKFDHLAVMPGPLSGALLHHVGGLAAFPNGDVVIADQAENTLLVVE